MLMLARIIKNVRKMEKKVCDTSRPELRVLTGHSCLALQCDLMHMWPNRRQLGANADRRKAANCDIANGSSNRHTVRGVYQLKYDGFSTHRLAVIYQSIPKRDNQQHPINNIQ